MKWILKYLMKLPAEKLASFAITLLKELAKRTDNTIDDEAVEILESIVEDAFA